MDINAEVWKVISETPGISDEIKKSLHIKIVRLVELARTSPVGKKMGVTVMTEGASAAGDPGNPPIAPKTL